MKYTRANIEQYVKDKGLEPVQIDGIPEGFSFKAPDIQIGDKVHEGQYIAYIPMTDKIIWSYTIDLLLEEYNLIKNGTK